MATASEETMVTCYPSDRLQNMIITLRTKEGILEVWKTELRTLQVRRKKMEEKENECEEEIEEVKLEIDKLNSLVEQIRKKRKSNYESDRTVVPYSMAATTRVKKLKFKEIQTPSWKEVDETTG